MLTLKVAAVIGSSHDAITSDCTAVVAGTTRSKMAAVALGKRTLMLTTVGLRTADGQGGQSGKCENRVLLFTYELNRSHMCLTPGPNNSLSVFINPGSGAGAGAALALALALALVLVLRCPPAAADWLASARAASVDHKCAPTALRIGRSLGAARRPPFPACRCAARRRPAHPPRQQGRLAPPSPRCSPI